MLRMPPVHYVFLEDLTDPTEFSSALGHIPQWGHQSRTTCPLMAVVYDLPLVPTSESITFSPAALLDLDILRIGVRWHIIRIRSDSRHCVGAA